MNTERTVQVKSMKKKHSCSRKFTFGHLVSPQWIASHLVKEIVFNPSIKLKELRELIRQNSRSLYLSVNVTGLNIRHGDD